LNQVIEEPHERGSAVLDPEFLKRLACPGCKVALRLEADKLVCSKCGRRFPIREGVPVLLLDEGEVSQKS
jgi:hypothetical protein